jgi:hypothetical protein
LVVRCGWKDAEPRIGDGKSGGHAGGKLSQWRTSKAYQNPQLLCKKLDGKCANLFFSIPSAIHFGLEIHPSKRKVINKK